MAETMTLQGGCLCGRIRYEVSLDSDEGYYCHCRMCQLAFGNTRAAFINVPQAAVRWPISVPTHWQRRNISAARSAASWATA